MISTADAVVTVGQLGGHGQYSQEQFIGWLESGRVLQFTDKSFELKQGEQTFVSGKYTSPKSKNISYNVKNKKVKGLPQELRNVKYEMAALAEMMERFAQFACAVIVEIAPQYLEKLEFGRTSFRPAQVAGRKPSVRKNDALLHVDSFPATPVHGKRILRVFSNINPSGEPRVWHVGQPMPQVIERFAPRLKPPLPGGAALMKLLRITKTRRTLYDHYMIELEDAMRADREYQKQAVQARVEFEPGSTWTCFTDQVSHAALSGQYALEQTFYLPVSAMKTPGESPLRRLEAEIGRRLI